jgi:hypothetical protein
MLLLLYNTLLRRLDPMKWKLYHQENVKDNKLKLLGLEEGDIVKAPKERETYRLEKGKKSLFKSWGAFVHRGYSMNDVKTVGKDILNEIELGPPLD